MQRAGREPRVTGSLSSEIEKEQPPGSADVIGAAAICPGSWSMRKRDPSRRALAALRFGGGARLTVDSL